MEFTGEHIGHIDQNKPEAIGEVYYMRQLVHVILDYFRIPPKSRITPSTVYAEQTIADYVLGYIMDFVEEKPAGKGETRKHKNPGVAKEYSYEDACMYLSGLVEYTQEHKKTSLYKHIKLSRGFLDEDSEELLDGDTDGLIANLHRLYPQNPEDAVDEESFNKYRPENF